MARRAPAILGPGGNNRSETMTPAAIQPGRGSTGIRDPDRWTEPDEQ